jgi:hypothetical protein
MIGKFASMEIRADFGPVYLLNFAAMAALVTWLLVAGPKHKAAWVRSIASALTWVFTLRYLRLLGRHSLYVYVWHVAIVYFVYYFDGRTPELNEWTKTAIALTAVGLLCIPAVWRERDKYLGTSGDTAPAKAQPQKPATAGPQQMVIR